jgi:hypothetical protein
MEEGEKPEGEIVKVASGDEFEDASSTDPTQYNIGAAKENKDEVSTCQPHLKTFETDQEAGKGETSTGENANTITECSDQVWSFVLPCFLPDFPISGAKSYGYSFFLRYCSSEPYERFRLINNRNFACRE